MKKENPNITLIHVCHKPILENQKQYDEIIHMEKWKIVSVSV